MAPSGKHGALRQFALAAFGFALGMLGLSAYAGTGAVKDAWHALLSSKGTDVKIADACTLPEKQADHDDQIYFISCGGIY